MEVIAAVTRPPTRRIGAPCEGLPDDWLPYEAGPQVAGDEPVPTLVFVHGLGTDARAWDRVAPDLAQTHRVLAVDVPGYALTTQADAVPSAADLADGLVALLDRLQVPAAVFVGHSFGGSVCLVLAQRYPNRCAGLVLLAPGGFGTELNPLLPLLNTRMGGRLLGSLYGPRASRTIERFAGRVTTRAIGGTDHRLRISELMETYDRLRTEEAREQFRASVRQSLALSSAIDRQEASAIEPAIPILVLWGRDDRVLPAWQAQNAATLLPWSVVHILDGAGHTPHRSMPAVVRNEVAAFADRGDVRRRLRGLAVSPAGS